MCVNDYRGSAKGWLRMSVRVAAVDPLPMFAHGISAVLSGHGLQVETPDDLIEWSRQDGHPVVLLTLLRPADWTLLTRLLTSRPDATVVTFLDEPDVIAYSRALAAGALGVLPRTAGPTIIRETFDAAVRDHVVLPARIVRALLSPPEGAAGVTLSEREIGWLRRLHEGYTVARLAADVGYSERMMFRLLAGVYGKLRVTSRTDAIVHAREQGWI